MYIHVSRSDLTQNKLILRRFMILKLSTYINYNKDIDIPFFNNLDLGVNNATYVEFN
jgi:hypothetical protein